MPHKIPGRPWESLDADICTINIKHSVVDYHSKLLVVKQAEEFSVDTCKIMFSEHGLSSKIVSGAGKNLSSEKFKTST